MHESRRLWPHISHQDPATRTDIRAIREYVLNSGEVKLIQCMGRDIDICHAARVLDVYEAWRGADDVKLLEHLYRNAHTTPFEHTAVTFYVKAPIFVFRQWHRHRTQSYNEMSARYKVLPSEFYVPLPEHVGVQSKKNHQSRIIGEDDADAEAAIRRQLAVDRIERECEDGFIAYEWLLNMGVPRELARGVTSVNTYSEMWATTNLWNWLRFLTLRQDEHAQYEIRVYADTIAKMLSTIFPVTMQIYNGVQEERAMMERVYDAWCARGKPPLESL